jgi:hypothetical protein
MLPEPLIFQRNNQTGTLSISTLPGLPSLVRRTKKRPQPGAEAVGVFQEMPGADHTLQQAATLFGKSAASATKSKTEFNGIGRLLTYIGLVPAVSRPVLVELRALPILVVERRMTLGNSGRPAFIQ